MSPDERQFYKELRAITSDPFINGLLVKYAQIGYTKAIDTLRHANDIASAARAQGEITAWEKLMNIKEFTDKVLKMEQ